MIDLQVRGIQELENKLNKLAAFGVKDAAQLKSINERVGKIYNGYLQANLKDADGDILVYTKTGKGTGKKASLSTFRRMSSGNRTTNSKRRSPS